MYVTFIHANIIYIYTLYIYILDDQVLIYILLFDIRL